MIEFIYEFLGESDGSIGYIHGREYTLVISGRNLMQRIAGVFVGIPFGWKVIIHAPFMCPYYSEDAFRKNWKFKGLRCLYD